MVNNKDNRMFMSQNYQSDSYPLEILCSFKKLAISPLKNLLYKEHQIFVGQLSANSSST